MGIFAWRYGYIPEDKEFNPTNLSITELEYRKANQEGITRLIFLLDEDTPWLPRYIDGTKQSGKSSKNINKLGDFLKKDHYVSFFRNPHELAGNVVTAMDPLSTNTSIPAKQSGLNASFRWVKNSRE